MAVKSGDTTSNHETFMPIREADRLKESSDSARNKNSAIYGFRA